MSRSPEALLRDGLLAQHLEIPEHMQTRLLDYLRLLEKWNRVYNLTHVGTLADMVERHVLDSLRVLPWVKRSQHLVDVGSGAGLPGIPLAVLMPGCRVTLVESNGKKCAFLQQAGIELGLVRSGQFSVQQQRVEQWYPQSPPDAVISRAFARLADFVALAGHLVDRQGKLYAMKAKPDDAELEALPAGWQCCGNHQLTDPMPSPSVPARRLLILQRSS